VHSSRWETSAIGLPLRTMVDKSAMSGKWLAIDIQENNFYSSRHSSIKLDQSLADLLRTPSWWCAYKKITAKSRLDLSPLFRN
jgi:hypothetical protein